MLNLATHVVDSDQVRALLEDPMLDALLNKIPPREGSYAWEMQELLKAKVAEALAEGEARGEVQGVARGEALGVTRGETQEALRFARRMIARKFGLPDPALSQRLEHLSVEQLEALGEALLDLASVAELEAWLERIEG
jgi:hypothetical protein